MSDKKIRLAFCTHGLGDVVHAATAMRLYVNRGYDVQIQIEPNKRWAWEAAGIPIHHGPEQLPLHPYYYPPDFFDLSKPDHTHSKIAHLFEVSALPRLGGKPEVWEAVCNTAIDATSAVSSRAMDDATKFLEGLPHPIILLHSKGTNWQEEKSIPDGIAFQLIRNLLETGGSVVTLDWDGRAPTLGHDRVRGIKPNWHHISLEEFGALCILADLFIGVDSGPFHLAGWFDIPTLYVSRKIPPVRCCLPDPMATYLVPAKDHEHWAARGDEWRFVEFAGPEATAEDITKAAAAILNGGEHITVRAADLVPIGDHDMVSFESKDIPGRYTYRRVGHDERQMELLPDGKIGEGSAGCERVWKIEQTPTHPVVSIYGEHGGPTCHLALCEDGILRGRWLAHEKMPIELVPVAPVAKAAAAGHPSDSLPDHPETFYVGIPTLFCRDLLHKCIESILAGSALPRAIYVVDNSDGTRMEPWVPHPSKRIRVIRPNANLGVARSWNLLHSLTQPAPLIITNDDVEIGHNLFEKMLACPEPWVSGSGHQMGCVFLLREKLWTEVGRFDETFWPAYHEDNDYGYRMLLKGYKPHCPMSDGYRDNGPSATKAAFNQGELNHFNNCFNAGRAYYVRKWGGVPHLETFTIPFNGAHQDA